LATAEAIYYFYKEFEALVGTKKNNVEYDYLLCLYALRYWRYKKALD